MRKRLLSNDTANNYRASGSLDEPKVWKQLQQSLTLKDPKATHMAIQRWGQAAWPNAHHQLKAGLRPVAQRVDDAELTDLIEQFDAALFSASTIDEQQQTQLATQIVAHLADWRKKRRG